MPHLSRTCVLVFQWDISLIRSEMLSLFHRLRRTGPAISVAWATHKITEQARRISLGPARREASESLLSSAQPGQSYSHTVIHIYPMSLQKLAHISTSRENLMKVATCFLPFAFAVQHVRPKQIGCVDGSVDSSSRREHAPPLQFMAMAIRHINGQSRLNPKLKMAKRSGRPRPLCLFFAANYL